MERIKKRLKDRDVDNAIGEVTDNALGSITVRTSVPTANQLKRNEVVLVGSDLYIKMPNNTVKRFSGADIT